MAIAPMIVRPSPTTLRLASSTAMMQMMPTVMSVADHQPARAMMSSRFQMM